MSRRPASEVSTTSLGHCFVKSSTTSEGSGPAGSPAALRVVNESQLHKMMFRDAAGTYKVRELVALYSSEIKRFVPFA
jgi:hypothetical protein